MTETKNASDGLISRLEERIDDLEDKSIGIFQTEIKEKHNLKN